MLKILKEYFNILNKNIENACSKKCSAQNALQNIENKGSVDINRLINEIEKNIATNDTKKLVIYNKKWEKHTQNNK